jgi:hypothetical protein
MVSSPAFAPSWPTGDEMTGPSPPIGRAGSRGADRWPASVDNRRRQPPCGRRVRYVTPATRKTCQKKSRTMHRSPTIRANAPAAGGPPAGKPGRSGRTGRVERLRAPSGALALFTFQRAAATPGRTPGAACRTRHDRLLARNKSSEMCFCGPTIPQGPRPGTGGWAVTVAPGEYDCRVVQLDDPAEAESEAVFAQETRTSRSSGYRRPATIRVVVRISPGFRRCERQSPDRPLQ